MRPFYGLEVSPWLGCYEYTRGILAQNVFIGVVPGLIYIDKGLIMDISHFSMDIEGFRHFKVVNWVGIPIIWDQSDDEEENGNL